MDRFPFCLLIFSIFAVTLQHTKQKKKKRPATKNDRLELNASLMTVIRKPDFLLLLLYNNCFAALSWQNPKTHTCTHNNSYANNSITAITNSTSSSSSSYYYYYSLSLLLDYLFFCVWSAFRSTCGWLHTISEVVVCRLVGSRQSAYLPLPVGIIRSVRLSWVRSWLSFGWIITVMKLCLSNNRTYSPPPLYKLLLCIIFFSFSLLLFLCFVLL